MGKPFTYKTRYVVLNVDEVFKEVSGYTQLALAVEDAKYLNKNNEATFIVEARKIVYTPWMK